MIIWNGHYGNYVFIITAVIMTAAVKDSVNTAVNNNNNIQINTNTSEKLSKIPISSLPTTPTENPTIT